MDLKSWFSKSNVWSSSETVSSNFYYFPVHNSYFIVSLHFSQILLKIEYFKNYNIRNLGKKSFPSSPVFDVVAVSCRCLFSYFI